MFVSDKVVDLFQIAKETVDELRLELGTVKNERDLLRTQLIVAQTNFDWLRAKVNQLEFENKALLQRAHGIQVPVPEIMRQSVNGQDLNRVASMEDMGDELARKFGMPTYSDKQS